MYSISKLCRAFHLSRSTLLYYDSIGLLKPSARTEANYRVYSEEDMTRLEQICTYREAGVPLEQIRALLNNGGSEEENVLEKRLADVNKEISLLRLQQKIIVELLKRKNRNEKAFMMDKNTFVSLLKASGVNDDSLDRLHSEFEKSSPAEHQLFLEFLGIDMDAIRYIREQARAGISHFVQD